MYRTNVSNGTMCEMRVADTGGSVTKTGAELVHWVPFGPIGEPSDDLDILFEEVESPRDNRIRCRCGMTGGCAP